MKASKSYDFKAKNDLFYLKEQEFLDLWNDLTASVDLGWKYV